MPFATAIKHVLNMEGGYVNDPADRGGATKFGVTETTARSLGYTGDMRELTREQAEQMYRDAYWNPLRLDDVDRTAPEIAEELFDTAVNQGVQTAGKYLQETLNLLNTAGAQDLSVDGAVGPATILRFNDVTAKPLDRRVLLKALNCLQAERYIEICRKDATQRRFFKGWMDNRVKL